ncbi:hypothetical protein EON67_01680, partial [archaeon]
MRGESSAAHNDVLASLGEDSEQFFCLQENVWGHPEPRVALFTAEGTKLTLLDATDDGCATLHFTLSSIEKLYRHAGDTSTVAVHSTAVPWLLVLTFASDAHRDEFITELLSRIAAVGAKVQEDATWVQSLPLVKFHRFEAVKVSDRTHVHTRPSCARLLPHASCLRCTAAVCARVQIRRSAALCTVMLSCATKVIHVIRCSDILNYETGCLLSQSVRAAWQADAHA